MVDLHNPLYCDMSAISIENGIDNVKGGYKVEMTGENVWKTKS